MHFFKVVFAFLSVGGASYALISLKEVPAWLKPVIIMMAAATVIYALPELPQAIDALKASGEKLLKMAPSVPPTSTYRTQPTEIPTPPTYTPAPEPPQTTYRAPQQTYIPPPSYTPPTYTPPPPKCAAIVMATGGGWGGSAGSGLSCSDRLERARNACNSHATSGQCGNSATGSAWVAGVHCNMRWQNGRRWNSYAGPGSSESEAFEKAFSIAASHGFDRSSCLRRIALWSEDAIARRY